MERTYFFAAFGTFGNPNGFRQSFFLGGNPSIAKEIRTFDLKTDAIKLLPQTSIYSIRKDYAGGSNLISYSVYTFAKEQNSDRGGTFIGSSLLFIDKTAKENIIINTLNDFHSTLEKNNISDETIMINHSDQFSIEMPKDFDKIGFNLQEMADVDFKKATQQYLVVYCETNPSQLAGFFSKSIDLLNVYDTIYFTQSYEIGEFVKHKRIFKIVDSGGFDKEIERLQEEKQRILQNSISDLEKEKESLEDEKKQVLDNLKRQIELNEKRHQENEVKIKESKKGLDLINREYDQYYQKIEEVIKTLKLDGKIEAAKNKHSENKRSFSQTLTQNTAVESLSPFSSNGVRVQGIRENPPFGNGLPNLHSSGRSHQERRSGKDGFKIATFVLGLLFVGALVLCCMWMPAKYSDVFTLP
ncbi:hypothetical protein [Chryseobacterium sp. Mn2064]|uniref:hypothetical protein n=1 Tax=Chryseobacterium sp. Mn2064 TaxID=3395263 RepID=UPI003BC89BAA